MKKINMVKIKALTIKIFKLFFSVQFLIFLLVGLTAAVSNYLSFVFIFNKFLPNYLSVAFAFSVGTIISFILNRTLTFKAFNEKIIYQIIKFGIAYIGLLIIGEISFYFMMFLLKIRFIPDFSISNEYISQTFSIIISTIYNYLIMKFFSFKKINIFMKKKSDKH